MISNYHYLIGLLTLSSNGLLAWKVQITILPAVTKKRACYTRTRATWDWKRGCLAVTIDWTAWTRCACAGLSTLFFFFTMALGSVIQMSGKCGTIQRAAFPQSWTRRNKAAVAGIIKACCWSRFFRHHRDENQTMVFTGCCMCVASDTASL